MEMSRRTGMSVEALSALKYAAGQSGVEMEAVETGVRKMQRAIVESAAGSRQASEAMLQLGLSIGDLKDLSPQRQFELIADRLSKVQNPTLRAAIAMHIFGRAGTELLPVIEGGKAGLAASAIPTLLVQGDNRPGLGHAMAQAIAEAEINVAFLVAQVIDAQFSAVIGFEDDAASKQAAVLIKKAVKKIEKQFGTSDSEADSSDEAPVRRSRILVLCRKKCDAAIGSFCSDDLTSP